MVSLSVFSLRVLRFFFFSRFLYFIPSSSVSLLCYWCLYCLGLHVGSISKGFQGGFFGCFLKNPVVKLGTLALKTICKPIANRLKKEAGLHPNFRHFIIDFAQVLSLLSPFFFFFIYGFLSSSVVIAWFWVLVSFADLGFVFCICTVEIALWSLIYIWVICQTQLIHVTIMNCNLNFVQIDIYAFEMRYHRQSSFWVTSR